MEKSAAVIHNAGKKVVCFKLDLLFQRFTDTKMWLVKIHILMFLLSVVRTKKRKLKMKMKLTI
jgi:hypothetical protein